MARAAKAIMNTKPAAAKRKSGRPAGTAQKAPAEAAKPPVGAKRAPVVAPAAPTLSKDALDAQVEKLERANAALRAKAKEANRSVEAFAARIVELEAQVEKLEKKLASSTAPAKRDPKPAKPSRASRQTPGADPDDAVPPGIAVQEPAPLDEAVETTLEKVEERLGDF